MRPPLPPGGIALRLPGSRDPSCFSDRTFQRDDPVPAGIELRAELVGPTTVYSVGPDAATRQHPEVVEARGRVRSSSADRIDLDLRELVRAGGATEAVDGRTTSLPRERIARMEEHHFDAGRTTALVGGTVLLYGLLTGLVLIAAILAL